VCWTTTPVETRSLARVGAAGAVFGEEFSALFPQRLASARLRTKVVAPYAVTFYVTHKCNLACSYCTQKEPDVFSDELPTRETIELLKRIRKETDSIVITGGEPTLRPDIEELAEAARFECKYRSLLLITNGTLLDRKPRILRAVTGLVVSLDALAADPTNPLSKPAALPKVLENLALAKELLGSPRHITISTVIEQWNVSEVERLLRLVRRARLRFCGAVCADRENAEPGAAEKSAISSAGRQDHRTAAATARSRSMARREPSRRCCASVIFSAIRRCFRGCIRTAMCFIPASRCAKLRAICCRTVR